MSLGGFDLDEVLDAEVKFGKYQIVQFMLIAFPIFLNGIFSSSYIFTAGTLNYRCASPAFPLDSLCVYMKQKLFSDAPCPSVKARQANRLICQIGSTQRRRLTVRRDCQKSARDSHPPTARARQIRLINPQVSTATNIFMRMTK